MKRPHALCLVLISLLFFGLLTGCASARKTAEEFPPAVDATVEAEPAEPDQISFLDVNPWSVEQGQSVTISVGGTEGRTGVARLRNLDTGEVVEVPLSETEDGRYEATLTVGDDLPPGSYRVEGELSGGPTGEPVVLVSDRTLSIQEPKPQFTACQLMNQDLAGMTQIYFDFDQSHLRPDGEEYVGMVASRVSEMSGQVAGITITGHTDERGTVEYNLALGSRRANTVRDALKEQGVTLDIRTVSKGEEEPVVPNATTEAEHQQNRRAEVTLSCR